MFLHDFIILIFCATICQGLALQRACHCKMMFKRLLIGKPVPARIVENKFLSKNKKPCILCVFLCTHECILASLECIYVYTYLYVLRADDYWFCGPVGNNLTCFQELKAWCFGTDKVSRISGMFPRLASFPLTVRASNSCTRFRTHHEDHTNNLA